MQSHAGTPQRGQTQSAHSPSISGAVRGTEGSTGGWKGGCWGRFCCFQENCRAVLPPPWLPSPLSTCTPQGAKAFGKHSWPLFYWFRLSRPFRRVGELQSLKEKKENKLKTKKKRITPPHLCCCPPFHSPNGCRGSDPPPPSPRATSPPRQALTTASKPPLYLFGSDPLPARKQFGDDAAQVAIS